MLQLQLSSLTTCFQFPCWDKLVIVHDAFSNKACSWLLGQLQNLVLCCVHVQPAEVQLSSQTRCTLEVSAVCTSA